MEQHSFQSPDGLKIVYRKWLPADPARAIVVINHGVNSHGGQHAWTAQTLSRSGFLTYAIDMRGRGQSEGKRFYVDDVEQHVGDLHCLVTLAKQNDPGLPVFLLGHSAGGVVGCCYALDHQVELAGFICESFAYQVPAPGVVLSLVRLISRVFPELPVLKLKMRDFTRDPEALAKLLADPLTKDEAQPARTVTALLRAGDRMSRQFSDITLPVLIIHGTADKATKYQGSQLFFEKAGSADKTIRLYEGHYHDLLNDHGKQEIIADVISWIDAHVGAIGQPLEQ